VEDQVSTGRAQEPSEERSRWLGQRCDEIMAPAPTRRRMIMPSSQIDSNTSYVSQGDVVVIAVSATATFDTAIAAVASKTDATFGQCFSGVNRLALTCFNR
jgi:hypothetical protein